MRLEFRRKKKKRENRLGIDKGEIRRRKKKVKILGLVVLFSSHQKKKKRRPLYFIYNFYFKNLIYKLIKQFENQHKSDPIL